MSQRADLLWNTDGTIATPPGAPSFVAASMVCADYLRLEHDLRLLESAGIDLLHIDVMDGNFVPRLGLGPDLARAIRGATDLPMDAHLMVIDLERFIPQFAAAGADLIFVHIEASSQVPRMLQLVRDCGARPGIALNPATPPSAIEYVIEDIDAVLLMMVNPGSVGERLRPRALSKIAAVRRLLGERANQVHILIDGNVNLENAPRMIESGATILACGTSSIFSRDQDVGESVRLFRSQLVEAVSRRSTVSR